MDGEDRMSRPRSTDPSVALSIAVPQSLKTRLDQELSYTQSRSKYVCKAIENKLNRKLPDIDEYRLQTLVWTAKHHKDCPKWLKRELSYYLESIVKKQVEGTVEEQ